MAQRRKRVAWGLAALSALLVVVFLVLHVVLPSGEDEGGDVFVLVPALIGTVAFAGVGALIAARSGNAIGWVFLAIALVFGATFVAFSYGEYAVEHAAPFAAGFGWLSQWLFISSLPVPVATFFLYPTGSLPSPRWRWPWRVYLAGLAVNSLGWAVLPFEVSSEGSGLENPLGIEALAPVLGPILMVSGLTLLASAFLSFASLVVRFRRAGREERQQIRWLALVGLVAAVALPIGIVTGATGEESGSPGFQFVGQVFLVVVVTAVTVGVPLAAGVAILKYRLYDLDLVIRKTAIALVLTALIVIPGLVILAVFSRVLIEGVPNTLFVLLGGIALGLLVMPLLRVARRIATRLAFGRRATPYEVLADFSGRVGETYATEDVLPRMVQVLARGTGASSARVTLKVGNDVREGATFGEPGDGVDFSVPVTYRGEELGELTVTMPAADPIDPARERLVRDVAAQAGPVLHNLQLVEDLRASRRRIVAAQDERAKKLERDIHDGAQQQLVALAVRLRLSRQLAARDPDGAASMLEELEGQVGETLEDLRDLARGIYPPLLADKGLAEALRAQARKAAVPVEIDADGAGRYPQEVESAAYFCCLEALQNVAKYANATRATVRLEPEAGWLTFVVTDDGAGFDRDSTPPGTGLQGMADRLAALGGTLTVASRPGEGTTLTGRIPLRA